MLVSEYWLEPVWFASGWWVGVGLVCCGSLLLWVVDSGRSGHFCLIWVESSFSLHRSNTLSITWGGQLERHVKFVSCSFSHGSQRELLLGILGYGLKFN